MAVVSIYLTEEQKEELKELKVKPQEVFRQGYIIESVLQGDHKFNNDYQKQKISNLIRYYQERIELLYRDIDECKTQINKLKGGENDTIPNKETENK